MHNYDLAVLLPLLLLVSAAAWINARSYCTPDWLIGLGCLCGLLVSAFRLHWSGAESSLLAMATGIFITLPFRLPGWLNAGDVKLMGAVGAILGLPLIFKALVFTVLSGLLLGLVALIRYGLLRHLLVCLVAMLRIQFGGILTELPFCATDIDRIRLPSALVIACGSLGALLQG